MSWLWTGKPGVLQSWATQSLAWRAAVFGPGVLDSQRVRQDLLTEKWKSEDLTPLPDC